MLSWLTWTATDECNSVGKTYVQLKLGFLRPNSNENKDGTSSSVNGREQVFVEMNLEQFYQFLASIEKCKSCIELFNPSRYRGSVRGGRQIIARGIYNYAYWTALHYFAYGPITHETEGAMGLPQAAAAVQAAERDETIAEVRQLIMDLRDAAQDGRDLARRYADVLQKVVDEYCDEFEKRAEAALARLEAKLTRRAMAKQQTREKVLQAAREMFIERGYEGATIRDIARAAGMSTGAVFASFTDKPELFDAILSEDFAALVDPMQDAGTTSASRADRAEEAAACIGWTSAAKASERK
eukprot:gene23716-30757_t